MPTMNSDEMTVNEDTDYSSYSYQHIQAQHFGEGDNSGNTTVTGGVEPLETNGGLEINEVAELVAMRVYVSVHGDNFGDVADTAQGHIEFRGVLGANVDDLSDAIQGTNIVEDFAAGDSGVLDSQDGGSANFNLRSNNKSEIFYHWQVGNDTPFSSDVGGVGGGGGSTSDMLETINFRELTGRGPVLDANDEISVVSNVNKNQVSAEAEANLRATLIWDVASVDDAGRRFSVPTNR